MTTCKGCYHRRILGRCYGEACHYSLDSGKLRGCSAASCRKNEVHYVTPKEGQAIFEKEGAPSASPFEKSFLFGSKRVGA